MKDSVAKILTIYRAIMLPWAENRYYNWDDDLKVKNTKAYDDRIGIMDVDFSDLTDSEAQLLGFPLWSEESGIRLVPIWLYGCLAEGMVLTSISGNIVTVGPDYKDQKSPDYIDNDHRSAALALGFIPRDTKINQEYSESVDSVITPVQKGPWHKND